MEEIIFKDILKNFLKENELTQTAFAGHIGVKPSQVSEWLKGKAKPGYDILKQIAKAFGISADYWLGLTDEY
jgi:transcriptional regulator with XRE-family HTH domain